MLWVSALWYRLKDIRMLVNKLAKGILFWVRIVSMNSFNKLLTPCFAIFSCLFPATLHCGRFCGGTESQIQFLIQLQTVSKARVLDLNQTFPTWPKVRVLLNRTKLIGFHSFWYISFLKFTSDTLIISCYTFISFHLLKFY